MKQSVLDEFATEASFLDEMLERAGFEGRIWGDNGSEPEVIISCPKCTVHVHLATVNGAVVYGVNSISKEKGNFGTGAVAHANIKHVALALCLVGILSRG